MAQAGCRHKAGHSRHLPDDPDLLRPASDQVCRNHLLIPIQTNAGQVRDVKGAVLDFYGCSRIGSAQSCHSSQCAVSVTRMTWAATSG